MSEKRFCTGNDRPGNRGDPIASLSLERSDEAEGNILSAMDFHQALLPVDDPILADPTTGIQL